MPQNTTRDVVISFADFVATAALPGAAGKLVSTLLPKIADIVFPVSSLESYVKSLDASPPSVAFEQAIVLQDGTTLNITVSKSTTPDIHDKLMEIYNQSAVAAVGTTGTLSRTQAYFPFTNLQSAAEAQVVNKTDVKGIGSLGSGGVSILNGIIGINW